jgi:hypothetical protein
MRESQGWSMLRPDRFISVVTRGLDPRVHLFRKKRPMHTAPASISRIH